MKLLWIIVLLTAQLVVGQVVDYDDDYTFGSTSGNDAKAWGGSFLDVELQGESAGTHVVCYDWCSNTNPGFDYCEYNNNIDFFYCSANFPPLSNYCGSGNCQLTTPSILTNEFPIGTGNAGDRWTCSVRITHYRNCGYANQASTITGPTPYYIISPRQYHCDTTTQYSDKAFYGSSASISFSTANTCPTGQVCDGAKDDNVASYGTYGITQPNPPCSISDGGTCSTTSQCLTTSACTSNHCCPTSQVWNGNSCGAPCTDNDYDGYSSQGGGNCCGISGTQTCGTQPDCNDNNAAVYPGATEVCNDGIDNDCDNAPDCADTQCVGQNNAQGATCCQLSNQCGTGNCGACDPNNVCTYVNAPYQNPSGQGTLCQGTPYLCSSELTYNVAGGHFPSRAYCNGQGLCTASQAVNAPYCYFGRGESVINESSYHDYCIDNQGYCKDSCTNNLDDDQNGCVDSDDFKCGGTETSCANNMDDDCDGLIDTNDPDCANFCGIPNGQSETCECDSNANCPPTHFCSQQPGWDPCLPRTPEQPCSTPGQYSCRGGDVHQCQPQYTSNGYVMVDPCSPLETCDPQLVQQTHQCSPAPTTKLRLDESPPGIPVYKQQGDLLKLHLEGNSINATFDTNAFSIESGTCTAPTECELRIDAEYGRYTINLGTQTEYVNIINDPATLYITSITKLYDRYPSESLTVNAILQKAYDKAAKKRGVVYDLDQYIETEHPFASLEFNSYHEDPLHPVYSTYDYVAEATSFTQEKCNTCQTVTIIGDDYVVPQYRHETVEISGNYWQNTNQLVGSTIYTDQSFNRMNRVPISNLEEYITNPQDDIKIIYPFTLNNLYQAQAQQLKTEIENSLSTWANIWISVDIEDSSGYSCEQYLGLKNSNQILIGTKQNNNLISCYNAPEPEQDVSIIYIDKSLWNPTGWALMIDTGDGPAVGTLSRMINQNMMHNFKSDSITFVKTSINLCQYIGIVPSLDIIGDACGVLSCAYDPNWGTCLTTNSAMLIIPGASIAAGKAIKAAINSADPQRIEAIVSLTRKVSNKVDDSTYLKPVGEFIARCASDNLDTICNPNTVSEVEEIMTKVANNARNFKKFKTTKLGENTIKAVDGLLSNNKQYAVDAIKEFADVKGAGEVIEVMGKHTYEQNGGYLLEHRARGAAGEFVAMKRLKEWKGNAFQPKSMQAKIRNSAGGISTPDLIALENNNLIHVETKTISGVSPMGNWKSQLQEGLSQVEKTDGVESWSDIAKEANIPSNHGLTKVKRIVLQLEELPGTNEQWNEFHAIINEIKNKGYEIMYAMTNGGVIIP